VIVVRVMIVIIIKVMTVSRVIVRVMIFFFI
jgi:hypothetical protein